MLADSLWGEKRPRHPEEAVRHHMGRIRKALESQGLPPIVMKMHRAYRADPPAGSLDLHRFRSFLVAARMANSAGDRESAAELTEKALTCWTNGRGRLPDLRDTPGLMAIACQLAVQRHKAQTWLASLQVDLDRQEELIPIPGQGGDADAGCLAQR
jgi:hypothetical protein